MERLNEFLADPSSDEESDSYSEDEEKASRINELKKNIQSLREAKIHKQDIQIAELEKEFQSLKQGQDYQRVSDEVIQQKVEEHFEAFEN